jgi:hypothetical protein
VLPSRSASACLIGLERGWRTRAAQSGSTFGISGLLGGIVGAIAQSTIGTGSASGGIVLPVGFAAYAAVITVFCWEENKADGTRNNEQTTAPEPHTGLQGQGGACRHQGRSNTGPANGAVRRPPQSDHVVGKAQLEEGAADVFGSGGGNGGAQPVIDVKSLHAKIL